MRKLLTVSLLLIMTVTAAHAQLRNAGFENLSSGKVADWSCPEYWSGSIAPVTDAAMIHGGKRASQLTAAAKAGRTWGRTLGALVPVQAGLDYRFSVFAKGTGTLKVGALNYTTTADAKTGYEYMWQQQPAALTDQWQEVAYVFTPFNDTVARVAPVIEIEGENAVALLDDASFQVVRQAEGRIVVQPYTMVPAGSAVTADVQVEREGKPAALPLTVTIRTAAGAATSQATSDAAGRVQVQVPAVAAPELVRVDVIQRELGQAATFYVDAVPQAVFDEFSKAAAKVKLQPLPQHLLFFGDSLTDFSRGYNYVDQLVFWLNRTNNGQITYRNAGVGGDYITRSLDRLSGKPGTHRVEMYEGVFEPKPARVFIMLGHNDSKLSSGSGFTQSTVSPEDYKAGLIEFVNKVKAQTDNAPFTLLSPTSSVYEICKANADKRVAAGGAASLFGKPEMMEQFTVLTKEAAEATGSDYIDLHAPTKAHPDKPSLFTADGVHLSLEGNHLLALEMLKHMGQQ